jgi:hypothetical protein
MHKKTKPDDVQNGAKSLEIDALCVEFLKRFYDQRDREKAAQIAARLRIVISDSPEFADSIRGEEVRSLIAELDGNFQEASRSREAELRKILELHARTVNTRGWEYVAREYDFSDVSDRLDLLAILYDRQGDVARAIATLRESQQYCISHDVPFDGQDLLDELEQGQNGARKNGVAPHKGLRTRKRAKPKSKA